MKKLNKKISIGTFWNFLELLLSKGATTLFTVFLAAFLTPKDFGLIAVLAIVFELSNVLVNAGFSQALIRFKSTNQRELSTAFWSNLGIGCVLYVVIFLLSEDISLFFENPSLSILIQVLGISILVNSLRIVQTAILSRKMDFRSQMLASLISTLFSGAIAVVMAYKGFGVWSLVVQILSSQFIGAVILWQLTRWKPSLIFDISAFKRLFDFGKFLIISNILNVTFKNSYALVIAKLFSSEILGLYYFSTKISLILGTQLTSALQKSSFPALSTLQDNNEMLRHKYRQIIQLTMFIMAPIMLIFIGLTNIFFDLLFDEKWKGAVVYTQLLCVVGLLYPVHSLNVNVLMVKGKTDLNLKLSVIKKTIQTCILVLSIPYGVIGIVIGQVIGSILSLIPNTYYTAKLIDYDFKMQILDISKPILAASLAGISAYFMAEVTPPTLFLSFFVSGGLALCVYISLSFIFKTEGLSMISKKVLNKLNNRKE